MSNVNTYGMASFSLDLDLVKALIPPTQPSDDLTLIRLGEVAFAAFERRTKRTILAKDYDLFFAGYDDCLYHTPEFPVIRVTRLQYGRVVALTVQFSGTTASEAGVTVEDDRITLTSTTNAVAATPVVLTYAAHPTFASLASAINAVSGWTATVAGTYGTWPTTEIVDLGYRSALSSTVLQVYGTDMSYRVQDYQTGELYSPVAFWRGSCPHRLRYRAGYENVPDDVAGCVAEMTALLWLAKNANPNFASLSFGPASASMVTEKTWRQLSAGSQETLNQYTNHNIVAWRM